MKQHRLHLQKNVPVFPRIRFLSLTLATLLLLTCFSACHNEKQPQNEPPVQEEVPDDTTAPQAGTSSNNSAPSETEFHIVTMGSVDHGTAVIEFQMNIREYSGGMARAEYSDGTRCYIGYDGKPITIQFKA